MKRLGILVLIYFYCCPNIIAQHGLLFPDSCFRVPEKYRNDYGKYRSPLIFYNGEKVHNSSDWEKRRAEILGRWNEMMGQWPALLKEQTMKIVDSIQREEFMQYKVKFYWTPNEETEGYLLIPPGAGKKPAVITVFYEPETAIGAGSPDRPNRDYAYHLVKRGFVTLSLGTSQTTKAQTYSIYYPDIKNATVQPLSMLACAAANAWYVLSKVPQVDSSRIGIAGHSYGGKWAMFASCLFDKFACSAWSDPGIAFDNSRKNINYWEPWYLGYYSQPWRKRGLITKDNPAKGLYPSLIVEGYDLQELHALMAPRPFLVSGGAEDPPERWIVLNHSIRVNKLLGYTNRVAMSNRLLHEPNKASNEIVYLFFEHFLKASVNE